MNVFVKDWPIHIIFLNMFNDIGCQTGHFGIPNFLIKNKNKNIKNDFFVTNPLYIYI